MKASIFLATHNKNQELPNTLYSISRQKTSFPFEICIVDDNSNEYPQHIAERFLKGMDYVIVSTNQTFGCKKSQSFCLDLMDDNSDIIVLQSSDVLYSSDDTLEQLVLGVEPGIFTMAEVRNIRVSPDLWKNWDNNIHFYRKMERLHETLNEINSDPKQPEVGRYTLAHTIFSGPRQPDPQRRLYFFLGAILKEDLLRTCFPETCYDVALSRDLLRLGMKVKYIDVIGIHQKHPLSL